MLTKTIGRAAFLVVGTMLFGGSGLPGQETAEGFLARIEHLPAQQQFELLKERVNQLDPEDEDYELLEDAASKAFKQPGVIGTAGTSAAPEDPIDRWHFRSFFQSGAGSEFSLHNPWDKISFWAGLGESRHGITLVKFDLGEKVLGISREGKVRELPLETTRIMTEDEPGGTAPNKSRSWGAVVHEAWPRLEEKWNEVLLDMPELREMREDLLALDQEIKTRKEMRGPLITAAPPDRRAQVAMQDQRLTEEFIQDHQGLLRQLQVVVMQHPAFAGESPTLVASFLAMRKPVEN